MTHRTESTGPINDRQNDDDPLDLATLIAEGVIDVVNGDPMIPLTVVRLADTDQASITDAGLSGSFADLLLALHTRVGDTVVALEDDPTLAGVCGGTGRRYMHAPRAADRGRIGGAALVLLRWPSATAADDAALTELLRSCRRMLHRDGKVIVVVIGSGTDAQLYIRQARQLMPAAYAAGLEYIQRLITVLAPIHLERPSSHASIADAAVLRRATHISIHGDTIAFTIRRQGRHA